MKRKLVAGLLAVVLTLGTLTGCGSSEGTKGETAPAAEGSADAAEAETADTAEAENAESASGEREKVVFWYSHTNEEGKPSKKQSKLLTRARINTK